MKQRLFKGMYTFEKSSGNLFGLRLEQVCKRSLTVLRDAGWYNKLGEKLGSGDLGITDFRKISRGLKKNEFFIVLSQVDSKWRFEYSVHGQPKVSLPKDNPGIDYVADHCLYIIAKNQLYVVGHSVDFENQNTYKICGLKFKVLSHEAAKKMITS